MLSLFLGISSWIWVAGAGGQLFGAMEIPTFFLYRFTLRFFDFLFHYHLMLHLCLACGLISCVSSLSFQFISLHGHVLGLWDCQVWDAWLRLQMALVMFFAS